MTEPQRSSWFIEWIKSALLEVQEYFRLCVAAIKGAFSRPFYAHDVMEQIDIIGLGSLTVVLLTGFFTGAVLALQSGMTLDQFGARPFVGRLISASMIKELGPGADRADAGRARRLGHRRGAGFDDRHRADRRLARARHRSDAQAGGAARARGLHHVPDPDGRGEYGGHARRVDHRRHAAARVVRRVLDVGRRRPLHPGRVDGHHQAVLSGLRDRDDWVPCRPADERRHPGRRPLDDQRRGRSVGGSTGRGLLRHAVVDLDLVLMRAKNIADFGLPIELVEAHAPVVLFDKVWLQFDEKVILRDVTFSVRSGHTKIFLGASGAGKSTILKLMLGLLKPDAGTVWVLGHRVDTMSESQLMGVRHHMGMVFQEGALFDSFTVGENVGYKLYEETDMPPDEVLRRVEEVLGFVGLAHHIDKPPSALSGGQRRRVAIARAMAARPKLLLYDEPTTGLDPMTALTVDAEIIKLRDLEQVTSVLVTHQLRDAFYVATQEAVRGADGKVDIRQAAAGEDRTGRLRDDQRRPGPFRGDCRGTAALERSVFTDIPVVEG